MKSSAPFNFGNALVDPQRQGMASDAMQQWMRGLIDAIGGEYQDYAPTSSGVPGFQTTVAQFRVAGANCELNLAFLFNGDGVFTEMGVSLPVPAFNTYGQFVCILNATPGGTLVNGNAYVNPDGLIHITLNNAAPFAHATIYCQLSGRYRAA